MNVHAQRAEMLLEQSRFELAEPELRRALATEPDNPRLHALLAVCLQARQKPEEALEESRTAIRLGPDDPHTHYLHGHILYHQEKLDRAHPSVTEAIRLDPYNPDYFGLLAAIELDRHKAQAALDAADQGLEIDPENTRCINIRAMALVKLGRKQQAAETIEGALSKDPDNALSHANQGWTCLHSNDPKKALEHFSEALRREPGMEWARNGLLQALRARYVIYRAVLAYYLWLARMTPRGRVMVIVGLFIAMQIGRVVSRQYPPAAPYIWPLLALYLIFVFVTWAAEPLFNLFLRLNRFGRMVLNRREIVVSNLLGLVLLVAIGCAVAYPFVEAKGFFVATAFGCGILVMVIGGISGAANQRSLMIRSIAAGLLSLIFLAAVILYWFVERSAAFPVAALFVLGAVIYLWTVMLRTARQ